MGNRAKAKGTAFETLIVKYLRSRSFRKAYRPATKGGLDTGDINGIVGPSRQAIIQCKNQRKFDLSGWLNDAVSQAQQEEVGHNALPILVVKRPGVGVEVSLDGRAIGSVGDNQVDADIGDGGGEAVGERLSYLARGLDPSVGEERVRGHEASVPVVSRAVSSGR